MKEFLRPTKITWIVLGALLVLNVLLFLVGLLLWYSGEYQWSFFIVPLFQIVWLYGLGHNMGIPLANSREFIDTPNFLGWTAILIGSLITLMIYYFLASLISKIWYRGNGTKSV